MIVFVEIYIRMRRAFETQKYSAPSLILSLLDRPNIGFGRSDILVSPNGFLFEAARRSPQYRRKCWPNHIGRGRWASLQIFDSQVRRLKIMPDWTGHRSERHRTARVAARCGSSTHSARLMQFHLAEMLRVSVSPAERIELRVTLVPGVATSPMIQAGLQF